MTRRSVAEEEVLWRSTAGWPPVGDPARLAEAMDRELDTPRDAARLRARAAEMFDVKRSIDAYEALLAGAPGSKRSRG